MEVKVDIKMNKTMMRKLSQAQVQAAEMTVEAVKTDVISKNVFPFDTGTLQNESTTIDTSKKKQGHFAISSNTPYARRLYFHPLSQDYAIVSEDFLCLYTFPHFILNTVARVIFFFFFFVFLILFCLKHVRD